MNVISIYCIQKPVFDFVHLSMCCLDVCQDTSEFRGISYVLISVCICDPIGLYIRMLYFLSHINSVVAYFGSWD